jgi:hypothetical protein
MPPADEQSAAELRVRAARARRLARYLAGDDAEEALLALADELEARADALEAENKS